MLGWFFKRGKESSSGLHPVIKNSFQNIKQDMSEVTKWIHHFHGITGNHQSEIKKILERLEQIEQKLVSSDFSSEEEKKILKSESSEALTERDYKTWEQLTNAQQKLAWILLRIDAEDPEAWLSLNRVAEEAYSGQEYGSVRSTITQYLGILEDFQYVERKRTGNQSLVRIKKVQLPPLRVPAEINFEVKLNKKQKK